MKEYDIFLPLRYNDGNWIEAHKFQELQDQLLTKFDGLTYFPQVNQGVWKFGDIVYRDEIVIIRVITARTASARRYLRSLKDQLKADFDQ